MACFICKKQFPSVRKLFLHFDLLHSNHNFDKYCCIEKDCNRTFHLRNSFSKHMKQHISVGSITPNEINLVFEGIQDNVTCHTGTITDPTNEQSNEIVTSSSLDKFIASLYGNPIIPRNAVQAIVTGMDKFLKEGLSASVQTLCKDRIPGDFPQEVTSLINDILKTVQSPLEGLMSEYKRFEHFETLGSYIPPREIVIGQRLTDVRRQGLQTLEPCACTEQMIPLRQILKSFLSMPNVLSEIFDYKKQLSLDSDDYQNFTQGSYWKSKHKEENVLPFFLFFDDFESGNVLGSHSGLHKLGAVYVSLSCMPPHRLSSLTNLFLVLLFHSADRTKFGNNAIFSPLIEEINYLKNTGIYLETSVFTGTMYFELALILGDNLGLHSILGFSESFSCNFPCRICKVGKDSLKEMYYEDVSLFRTSLNYFEDFALNNVSLTGIKERCVWWRIEEFSLFDQVGVDLMHDFFEGCVKYVMVYLINYYIKDLALFSLEVLNDRIFAFDYGPDTSSKPVAIRVEHVSVGNLRQSAAEAWNLCKYFGLLIGDFVPTNEPSWDLYITLRKVLDLLVLPSIDKGRINLLRTLLSELNELYVNYSREPLKPKFHFLIHYPTIMEKFGPVIHFWAMRYEAKHRVSKISARSSFNRRNICKTLAIKHQLQLNEMFLKGKLSDLIQTGPETELDTDLHNEIVHSLGIEPNLPLVSVSWAKVNGTLYKAGSILTGDYDEEAKEVLFFLIQQVFLFNLDRTIFMCQNFTTLGFDDHFQAFEVKSPSVESDSHYIFQETLVSHAPNTLTCAPNGCKYITLRS